MGVFSMPLQPSRLLNACFKDTTKSPAWSCHLTIYGLRLTVNKTKENSLGDYTATITFNQTHTMANHVYSYGEQPYLMDNPVSLELVNDTSERHGPAWFKQLSYNKTVIVPAGALSRTNKRIRDKPRGGGDFKRKGIIQPGDKPWICTWPDTYLELFIYPHQNSSLSTMKPLPFGPPGPFPGSSSPSGTTTAVDPGAPQTPQPSPSTAWDPSETGKPYYRGKGSGDDWGPYPDRGGEGNPKPTDAPTTTTPTDPTATAGEQSSSSTASYEPIDAGDNFFTPPPPPYPKVIKLEERRMYSPRRPVCQQVEVREPGEPAVPLKDDKGKPIIIEIIENEPLEPPPPLPANEEKSPGERRGLESQLLARQGSPGGPDTRTQCGCEWVMT